MNALMSPWLNSHLLAFAVLFSLLSATPRGLCADAIHSAAEKGDLKKVTELVAADPGVISSKDKNGKTPLHVAVEEDHRDVAEFLINHGRTSTRGTKLAHHPSILRFRLITTWM